MNIRSGRESRIDEGPHFIEYRRGARLFEPADIVRAGQGTGPLTCSSNHETELRGRWRTACEVRDCVGDTQWRTPLNVAGEAGHRNLICLDPGSPVE